jgi:hypothetical protein
VAKIREQVSGLREMYFGQRCGGVGVGDGHAALDPAAFCNVRLPLKHFTAEDTREIVFKAMLDDAAHHSVELGAGGPVDYRSVIALFARQLLKELHLVGGYDLPYPRVRLSCAGTADGAVWPASGTGNRMLPRLSRLSYNSINPYLWATSMKTTIELPDHLMREVKIRAAQTDRKLKDVIAEFIQRGLETPPQKRSDDPLQALMNKLVFEADGSVTNPDGIDDAAFFEALEDIRTRSRSTTPRDPFVDHGGGD